jgi:hypothetical protein
MPVFGYLSEDEAEDVYVYLTLYPTRASTTATATASIISIGSEPPSGASPANRPSLPTTAGEGDPQPISLVRFAVFPIVLFLFLGSITAKYLPLLAKADHDRESGIISFGASVSGQPTAAAVEIGGEGAPAMRSGVSLDQVP